MITQGIEDRKKLTDRIMSTKYKNDKRSFTDIKNEIQSVLQLIIIK